MLRRDVPVVLFLGGNDLLRDTPVRSVRLAFRSLLRLFRKKLPGVVLILIKLPAFPRCSGRPRQLESIDQFNTFLSTLKDMRTSVVHLSQELKSTAFFHLYYGRSKRPDGVHLNDEGYRTLVRMLTQELIKRHEAGQDS
ncbi:MAG: SGNH/GDSL hydrolase family protein, partial [Gammaproteobacteria bacterium]